MDGSLKTLFAVLEMGFLLLDILMKTAICFDCRFRQKLGPPRHPMQPPYYLLQCGAFSYIFDNDDQLKYFIEKLWIKQCVLN